ncbi:MAG: ATP-binding protein [Verrucomicrobiota bacterium]|nr:ATP-binding protein [Verrucomicrobiota bacterium]
MHENNSSIERARLPICKMQDVLLARFVGRNEAAKMGFSPKVLTRISTAVAEITRNVIQHSGGDGEMQIMQLNTGDHHGLRIVVFDYGKGIAHPELYTDNPRLESMGSGLAGIRKIVDHFHIESTVGSGTTVTMEFWLSGSA